MSTSNSRNVEATVVWSWAPHWSAGIQASSSSATLVNQDLTVRAGPAVEFSVYPCTESTRRQITALYRIGGAGFD